MARPRNLLATPADLGWLVRPGPDYEIEDDDEDGILFKFGRMVAPTDEEILDWLRAGTSGDCGGEETEGWHDGGWWVDISCCVSWGYAHHSHGTRYYAAGDEGKFAIEIAEGLQQDAPSLELRLHAWRDLMDRTCSLLRKARDGLVPDVELRITTYEYLMGRTRRAARYLVPRGVKRDKRMYYRQADNSA